MWFKNIYPLRFEQPFTLTAVELEARLQQRPFRHCSSLEPVSIGWAAPLGKDGAPLVHATNGYLMLCLKKEEKILPGSVVNEVVAERVDEIEAKEGRQVRKKERDGIRDEVMQDLLPKAFAHTRRTYGYIDPKGGWLLIDTATAAKAEEFTSLLRQCLGSLPVHLILTAYNPTTIMTDWLGENGPPPGVTLESECELRSPEQDGGIIRARKHDLGAEEIRHHLEAGKEVIQLAITWNDRLSMVLDGIPHIKRLRFLDVVRSDAAVDMEFDSEAERFDAEFAIMSLELAQFLPALGGMMFGGFQVPAK